MILRFALKVQICLAELMHVTTEKKIVPLALAFGMSYIFWECFFHANFSSNLSYLNCLYSSINID